MNTTKSEQIKQGLHKSFQNGASKKAQTVCYGYTQNSDGTLIVQSEQASVVRTIFDDYLAGYSLGRIVAKLQQQGIPSPAGKPKWNSQAIDKMLNNEKYTGNVVLGKTVTQDGIQIKNRDTSSLTEMQDTHPAIISQEIFEAVQEEKARRIPGVAKYNSSNILSGLLVCGECGSPYRRLTRRHGEIVWRCANRVEHGNRVCRSSSTIPESKVFEHIAATLGCSNEQVVRGMIDKIMVKADSTLHITFRQKARNPFAARER